MLSTLTEWSRQHICDIFEAPSDNDALLAIASTFSATVEGSINGQSLNRAGIEQLVLAMRKNSSPGGLRVHWQETVDVPKDSVTNRNGSFGGIYYISGLQQEVEGNLASFERRKVVSVQIESESPDTAQDSRRIVHLVFVATNVRVN
ncbi:hypothetical protein C8J56DRAFT_886333 [Mycena floridula]|nr:hypothetical protein C8J56DRAFT_886333 [Mycena floridula]